MTTLLDVLDLIGRTTWEPVWIPILAWTVFALPLWLILKQTDRLHPLAEYRLSQVLLAALPIGLLATSLANLLPDPTGVASAQPLSVTILPAVETPSVTTSAASSWQWTQALGVLTAAAGGLAVVRLGRLAFETIAVVHVRTSMECTSPSSIQTEASRIAHRLRTSRPFQICLTSEASIPITLGGLRPTILIPTKLADDPKALRMTLVHECIHIRRYDDLAHFLERVVSALFAAHPLVDPLRKHVAEAREQACDAAVLTDDQSSPADYARLLLALADGARLQNLDVLSLSESPSSLNNRLRAMESSVSSWLSSRLGLGTTLLAVGLLLTLGVVACSDSVAPSSESPTDPDTPIKKESSADVYTNVANMESPPDCGGVRALSEKIQYPELARKAGIEGRVFVQFIVDKNGLVTASKVKKGVHRALDKEALAAVKSLECKPGMMKGDPVKVQMNLPVTFKLPDDAPSDPSSAKTGSNTSAGLDQITFHDPDERMQDQLLNGPAFNRETRASLNDGISYPDLVRKAGIEGRVGVTFTLDASGNAENLRVTQSLHRALDAQVLHSVKNTTFVGEQTKTEKLAGTTVSVQFSYRQPGSPS